MARWGPWSLFLLMVIGGLYLASLTAEGLVRATYTLPGDIERLAGQVSRRIAELVRDQPYLRAVLPEPGTIDRLGDTNRALLIDKLSYGLTDFTAWVIQGFIVLVLAIFLLIESRDADGQGGPVLRPDPGRRPAPPARCSTRSRGRSAPTWSPGRCSTPAWGSPWRWDCGP